MCSVSVLKVVWLSAGVSSFIAGWLAGDVDKWIYIDIKDQHPDSLRFVRDCEKAIGKPIEILRSEKFDSVESVIRKYKYINSPYGAPCTGMLKKAVRKKWEGEHKGEPLTYVWGMDATEKRRADGIIKNFPEFNHEFPLIDKLLDKNEVHGYFKTHFDFDRPAMYDLGYQNNNCIGCVKGGQGYWNKIRKDFPQVFEARAKLEREIGASCLNGIYLDELPPDAGKEQKEIMGECGFMCLLAEQESEK